MGHFRHFKFGDRSSGRKNPGLQLKQSSCSSLHLRQFSFSPSIHLFNVGDIGDDVGDIGDDVGDIGDDVDEIGDDVDEIGDDVDDIGDIGDDVGDDDVGDDLGSHL